MKPIIKVENLSKQYRLGTIGTGTVRADLQRWLHRLQGKEDPFLKIGETNDRSKKGESDYVWALKDINFEVMPGEVVGIIGKNGAGKSTLLKILSKVTGPTTGRIDYNGRIGSLLEVGTGFHPELTGRENIFLNGAILGMTKREIRAKLDEIIDFSGCERYIDTPVKRYSSGMTVRLGFAVAANLDPEILVVDEVLAVGDAEFQKKAVGKMQDVSRNQGRTVLFVSHNMGAVQNLCPKSVLLANGQFVASGITSTIIEQYEAENKASVGNIEQLEITDKNRLISVNKEVEICHIQRLSPYQCDVVDPIEVVLRLKKNTQKSEIQLTALINNVGNGGLRSGMAFTEVINIKEAKDYVTVKMKIENHNIVLGKYLIDFYVGIGDIKTDIKYYDAVYDTVSFEIERYKGDYINTWHNYWGSHCYTNISHTIER